MDKKLPKRIKYKGQIYEAVNNTDDDNIDKVYDSIDTSTHVWKPNDFFSAMERLSKA